MRLLELSILMLFFIYITNSYAKDKKILKCQYKGKLYPTYNGKCIGNTQPVVDESQGNSSDSESKASQKREILDEDDSTSEDLSSSSMSLRSGKKIGGSFGFGVRTTSSIEGKLCFSYFLHTNSVLDINYLSLSGKIMEQDDDKYDPKYYEDVYTELKGYAIGVNYKRFFSNSFYGAIGLDYTKLQGKFVIAGNNILPIDLKTNLGHYVALKFDVRIGNQWQWENFTLGADWVGMLLPIYQKENFTDALDGDHLPNSMKSFKKEPKSMQLTILRSYIGWNFH